MVTYLNPSRESHTIGYFDGEQTSLSAAQADYESRILAALTPAEQPEQCFEVKEGYFACGHALNRDTGAYKYVPLSEALTIRSAEDVRREALEEVRAKIWDETYSISPEAAQKSVDILCALIDTPAQSPDKAEPCPNCGISDDGIGCGCDHGLQDQPSPEPVVCPCTTYEQDETCPVGFPSLLCWACGGSGKTTPEKITQLAAEMMRIADQVGETEDPFAVWEAPPDKPMSVAEAAKVLLEAWGREEVGSLTYETIHELRALAAQGGE